MKRSTVVQQMNGNNRSDPAFGLLDPFVFVDFAFASFDAAQISKSVKLGCHVEFPRGFSETLSSFVLRAAFCSFFVSSVKIRTSLTTPI